MCNFGLSKHLTTHSLLLTGNLSNNINNQVAHILYILYCSLQESKLEKGKKIQIVTNLKKIFQYIYWKKIHM